jgi:hypothetical protein
MLKFDRASVAQIQTIRMWARKLGTKMPTPEQEASWDFDKADQIILWYKAKNDAYGADKARDHVMTPEQEMRARRAVGLAPAAPAAVATTQVRTGQRYNIPDGRYALQIEGDKNEWSFFEVSTPEKGKWEGFTFATQVASANEWPVRGARRHRVLEAIAADVEGALAAYGQNTEHCGLCNRPLHNDESKARGIGPKCAAKAGL